MGKNDILNHFDVDLSAVSGYIEQLKGYPDESYIVLDEVSASALSGASKGSGINPNYLSNAMSHKDGAVFGEADPCVILMKKQRNGDSCLATTVFRQGFDNGTPVMKGDPALLSSDNENCVFFHENHAELSGLRYEDDLSRYSQALSGVSLNTVIRPCECGTDSNKMYFFESGKLRYQAIDDYLKSGRKIVYH